MKSLKNTCRSLFLLLTCTALMPAVVWAAPHFEVFYWGSDYDEVADATTYHYEVCTNGAPPELSFFMVKIPCAPNEILSLLSTDPAGGSLGSGGQPVNHVHGVKWECGNSLCPDENGQYNCVDYSMTFAGNLGEELSSMAFVKAGPGVDEHPTTAPSCEPGTNPEPVICDACGPYTAYCYTPGIATAALDGSGSSGDPLYYVWTSDCPDHDIEEPFSATTLIDFDPVDDGLLTTCKAYLQVSDDEQGLENCEAVINADPLTCELDCLGIAGGTAEYDDCQVCDGNNEAKDECGECFGNGDPGCGCGNPAPNECGSCEGEVDLGCGCGNPAPNACNSCYGEVDLGCGCGNPAPNACNSCYGEVDLGCGCGEPAPNECNSCEGEVDLGCGCGNPAPNECGSCQGEVDLGCGCGEPAPNACGSCSGEVDLGCGCGEPAPNECNSCEGEVDLGCGCGEEAPNECNSCSGDTSCFDCFGVANGTATAADCGSCNDIDITSEQFVLDGTALEQRQIVRRATRMLLRNGGNKKVVQRLRQRANNHYENAWQIIWSLPSVMTSCEVEGFCAETSNASEIDQFRNSSLILRNTGRRAVRALRRTTGLQRVGQRLLRRANNLHQENMDNSSEVPVTSSSCT